MDYILEKANNIRNQIKNLAVNVDDQTALKSINLIDKWKEGVNYIENNRVTVIEDNELVLYKCRKPHTSLVTNKPSINTASLWTKIDVEHTGTIDDPIPAAPNMEYMCGKYYVENSVIYLMKRDGMFDGEKIILDYLPSQLVEHYFIIVKTEGEENEKMEVLNNLNYIDSYNAIAGAVVAFLTLIFGEHWLLFALFLFLNVVDWITGWMKSRINKKENSVKGWQGVLKKIGYWLMILSAFMITQGLIEVGVTIGIDLGITTLLGWFVLASLLVNEARSIVENFCEAGFDVPKILINGLEVANKMINKDDQESE